jgi:hypothetical protein
MLAGPLLPDTDIKTDVGRVFVSRAVLLRRRTTDHFTTACGRDTIGRFRDRASRSFQL